jgi:O-antigen/teichoic acid export membrane protein
VGEVRSLRERFSAPLGMLVNLLLSRLKDRLLRNAGYLFGVTVVGAGAGFVFWWLAARFYETTQVGLASSVISIVQLLASIAVLGLGAGLVRFLAESRRPQRLLNAAFTLTTMVALLGGGIFLIGVEILSPSLAILATKTSYAIGLLFLISVSSLSTLLQASYLARREAKYALWQVLCLNGLRLVLIVALTGFGAMGIVAALAISVALADGVGLLLFLSRVEPGYRPRPDWSRRILGQLIPYSIGNYTADLFYRAPLLLVTPLTLELLGSEASAHVYVAWMIGSLIASPALALAQSAFAEGSFAPGELRPTLMRAGRYAMVITIPLAGVVGLGAPILLRLFGASYADQATTLLRWLALASPLMAFTSLFFSALRVRKRVGEMILLAGLICAITLAYPFVAVDTPQLHSMAVGWLIGQALVSAVGLRVVFFKANRNSVEDATVNIEEIVSQIRENPKILVAIPCYNEADFIASVVEETLQYSDQVVVVDDGSTDGTAEVARSAGALVVRHSTNLGPGAAARTCLQVGHAVGAQILVTLDGDGQHNPEEIPEVIAPVQRGEADLVIGSRFLGKDNNVARYRKFGIDVITFLYNFGGKQRITDAQSCFRAYGKKSLDVLRIRENGFGFSVETLVQARRVVLRIREASISCLYHEQSHSANPVLHGVGVALMVVKHRMKPGARS